MIDEGCEFFVYWFYFSSDVVLVFEKRMGRFVYVKEYVEVGMIFLEGLEE